MNCRVYPGAPFEFSLTAVDSKGQETHSPKYRIHLVEDDYASRVECAMTFLAQSSTDAREYGAGLSKLENDLNIISTVAGGSRTWAASQSGLLDNLRRKIM